MRRYEEADAASQRLLALGNEAMGFYEPLFRACGFLEGSADLEPLRKAVAAARPSDQRQAALFQVFQLVLALGARDPNGIEEALAANVRPRIIHYGSTYPKSWFQALAYRLRGDEPRAQTAFAAARSDMESVVQANPADPRALSILAMIDAGLGRNEQAVRGGERALEMASIKTSAVHWPVMACNLAVVYAWTNQPARAIALLEEAAGRAAAVGLIFQPSYGDLRLNPIWDPLRNEPRFNALMERLAPADAASVR
jgi:serine/threonine-protein kinase